MPGFIVLEGLNGSGKSTLAKLLADSLGGVALSTPPDNLLAIRHDIDENASLLSRYYYYMLGNTLVSDKIRELRKTLFVICDRFVHSTIANHSLLGVNIDPDTAVDDIEVPDISFFITTSDEAERTRRINDRGKKTKWHTMYADPIMREKYIAYFRNRRFIFLDTSHQTILQSLAMLLDELAKLGFINK